MQMQESTNTYRIERWIALFLSLLFLLPFFVQAANAQELQTTSLDQAGNASLLLKTTQAGQYLPVLAVNSDVDLRVTGVILRAHVTQTFVNPTKRCVEGIYVFPLPENSAVDTLRMMIGTRVIEGEIHEREEAKAIYEEAKTEGRKASLVEQQRPNMFTTSVASVLPGETVKIEIEYQQVVRYDNGRFSLRFPTVVAPRYNPASTTTGTADADGATVRTGGDNHVKIHVSIDAGLPIVAVGASSDMLKTTPVYGGPVEVTLADEQVPADHDFVLEWHPQIGGMPQSTVFTETVNGETYALFMVIPPVESVTPVRVPRETIFIIDSSGSMAGTSMEQAKQALRLALDSLQPSDTFNIVDFDSSARRLFPESRPADAAAIDAARTFVGGIEADGGTEMMSALQSAFETPESQGRVRQVIFMTDGQVGNERELFDFITAHLGNSRLFTVGIGSAPNSHFMSGAARMGRGTFTYIADVNEVQDRMNRLFLKLENPVLTDVALSLPAGAEAWPSKVPDLYAGEPLVITAKLPQSGRVSLQGKIGSTAWSDHVDVKSQQGDGGISKLWTRHKIEALMDSLSEGADEDVVKHDVIDLALANHLVSQYTSLVAVDRTPTSLDSSHCVSELVPLNTPAGSEEGSLPQTATPMALMLFGGGALIAVAVALRMRT